VKCGCNAAFLVDAVEHDDDTATVTTTTGGTPRQGVIERTLLRPALRGEDIGSLPQTGTLASSHSLRVIWTHDQEGAPLRTLPPATTRWLLHWRPRLASRADARHRLPWWTLFRTDAARFDRPRVVWADIGRRLRLQVLRAGDPTVPLNSCYVVRPPSLEDAYALTALLQSTIAASWLDVLAEPARGGFRRFLGWTVGAFPIPADWPRAVSHLADLGRLLAADPLPPDDGPRLADHLAAELDECVAMAYQIPIAELLPLIDWYRA
jgi:hypothetical protein